MIPMERGLELHGRSCANDDLTDADKADLDAWYAQMDAEEARDLHFDFEEHPTVEELREELRLKWEQIAKVVSEIQAIEAANEQLRQQNDKLKEKLAAKGMLVS